MVAATASAASPTCTIHPKKDATKEELAAMAKVTQADARKTALASLKDPSKATVKSAELEAEHGCLLYSFDIEVAGKTGVQEVQIDAGPHADTRQIEDDDRADARVSRPRGQCRGNVTCADAQWRSVPQVEAECDVLPADGLTDLTQDIERCQRFQSDDHASGAVGDSLPRALDRRNARVQPNGGD